jgi:hypothetical protein
MVTRTAARRGARAALIDDEFLMVISECPVLVEDVERLLDYFHLDSWKGRCVIAGENSKAVLVVRQ